MLNPFENEVVWVNRYGHKEVIPSTTTLAEFERIFNQAQLNYIKEKSGDKHTRSGERIYKTLAQLIGTGMHNIPPLSHVK